MGIFDELKWEVRGHYESLEGGGFEFRWDTQFFLENFYKVLEMGIKMQNFSSLYAWITPQVLTWPKKWLKIMKLWILKHKFLTVRKFNGLGPSKLDFGCDLRWGLCRFIVTFWFPLLPNKDLQHLTSMKEPNISLDLEIIFICSLTNVVPSLWLVSIDYSVSLKTPFKSNLVKSSLNFPHQSHPNVLIV